MYVQYLVHGGSQMNYNCSFNVNSRSASEYDLGACLEVFQARLASAQLWNIFIILTKNYLLETCRLPKHQIKQNFLLLPASLAPSSLYKTKESVHYLTGHRANAQLRSIQCVWIPCSSPHTASLCLCGGGCGLTTCPTGLPPHQHLQCTRGLRSA